MANTTQRSQLQSFTLPSPSVDYSTEYMNSLVRTLEIFFQREQEEGNIRGSTLILTQLPTSGANLFNGEVYVDETGFLKVVRSEDNFTPSLSTDVADLRVGDVYIDEDGFMKVTRSEDNFTSALAGSVGSVTVTIS